MSAVHHTPKDFASIVYGNVVKNSDSKPLSLETIESVVDAVFWTSLRKEEAESHLFNIIITTSKKVDVTPPPHIRYDRWQFIPFAEPIELNQHNLAKLGAAASSESALIVVHGPGNRQPVIIGLIDQQLAYYRSARHEMSGSLYLLPLGLVLKILGTGHLVATYNNEPIAELRGGEVLHDLPDVFGNGPIYKALRPGFDTLLQEIYEDLSGQKAYKTFCGRELRKVWASTFKRLLCEIRDMKHGGAILVLSTADMVEGTCKIKYLIDFERLHIAIVKQIVHTYQENQFEKVIHSEYLDRNKEVMPVDLYLEDMIARYDRQDANAAIAGSIKFISTLSKHDGAVLMSPDFSVSGFGVEVTTSEPPEKIVSVKKSSKSVLKSKPINPERFGTRHRSAMRFCWTNPGSVAFVISQDGGVRAITRLNERVVIWEDIKLLGES